MEYCPVCRARFSGNPVCRRCKSDLSMVLQLEGEANQMQHQAIQAFADGNIDKARNLCDHAATLKKTPLSRAFAGFLASQRTDDYNY